MTTDLVSLPDNMMALPAHLQQFNSMSLGVSTDAMGGITLGKSHHRVSVKGKMWRLQDPQGQEFVVQQFNLDVIIVGANAHVSKTYYDKKYNPNAEEALAPACFSDNGTGPSTQAAKPQCGNCATCPFNQWGSRVTDAGTRVKACMDSKKLAVVLAENPSGAVYELRVPAASMENIFHVANELEKRKIGLNSVVMRLTFDQQAEYPKIVFTPVGYISAGQLQAVQEIIGSNEVNEVVGADDTPAAGVPEAPVAQAPAAPALAPAPQAFNPMAPAAPAPAPQAFNPMAPAASAPAPQALNPMAPAAQAPQAFNPMAPAAPAPQAFNPMAPAAPAPKQRRRRAAAPSVPSQVEPPTMQNVTATPFVAAQPVGFPQQDTPNAVASSASVPLNPQPTDANMDELLKGAFSV